MTEQREELRAALRALYAAEIRVCEFARSSQFEDGTDRREAAVLGLYGLEDPDLQSAAFSLQPLHRFVGHVLVEIEVGEG